MKFLKHFKPLAASLLLLSTFGSFGAVSYDTELHVFNNSQQSLVLIQAGGSKPHHILGTLPSVPVGGRMVYTTVTIPAEEGGGYFIIDQGQKLYDYEEFFLIMPRVNASNTGLMSFICRVPENNHNKTVFASTCEGRFSENDQVLSINIMIEDQR